MEDGNQELPRDTNWMVADAPMLQGLPGQPHRKGS